MIYDFEKEIFNIHSVYVHCPECFGWGINMPLNRKCDAGHNDGIAYYDAESIDKLISSLLQAQREKDAEICAKLKIEYAGQPSVHPGMLLKEVQLLILTQNNNESKL